MKTVAKTVLLSEDFVGAWQIERSIKDARMGTNGQLTGSATFTPNEHGLAYIETGVLHLQGHAPFKAERRYQWRFVDGAIHVDFYDCRSFHSFDPASPSASHWCDPDTYNVTYEFADWPNWRSIWDVTGPKKDYQMITDYARHPM